MNLVSLSQLTSLSGLWCLCFSHATPSHFTGQLRFCVSVHDYIPAPCSTSSPPVVWVAVSSWASAPESEIRVRLQSVPLLPLLMLQARKRAAGSPAATQIQPAEARTQAPGRQSATVCHFNPHTPTGLLERGREGGHTERKRAPRGRGIFFVTWTMIGTFESLVAAGWMFGISTINRSSRGCSSRIWKWIWWMKR